MKPIVTSGIEMTQLQHYYEKHSEQTRECLYALKSIIEAIHCDIVHCRRFQIPNFTYRGFNLAYLWVRGKKISVGFIEDRRLLYAEPKGQRDVYTSILVDPRKDIPSTEIVTNLVRLIKQCDAAKSNTATNKL